MIRKIAQYRVRPESIEAAKAAVTEFVDAVVRHEPGTIYDAYLADDGVTFVHVMAFLDAEAEAAHRRASYTGKLFQALRACCDREPVYQDVALLRSARARMSLL